VGVAPKGDARALELLVNLNHYSGLPLLLRDQLRLCDWPADAAWSEEAHHATQLADQGKWQQAAEVLDQLGGKFGAQPTLVYNRAVLAGRLADDAMLAAGLHAYAQMDVPIDNAVEAEAIAQLLEPERREELLDSVIREHAILDLEALMDRLTADRRTQVFEVDPAQFAGTDQPRPQNTFVLLDQPLPESGVGIAREAVPSLVGVIAIFGRQTDREARVELTTDRGRTFDGAVAALAEICGDSIGPLTKEHVIGSTTPTEQALHWRWHFPVDTPPDERRKLVAEQRHAAIVQRWPDVPRPSLNGKSPREVAGDPQQKIPLMAAVLILEQGSNMRGDDTSIAVLREKLGLPQAEPIDPTGEADIAQLPLVRVPRLEVEKVSDADLVQLYRRSVLMAARAATAKVAAEAVVRPSVADRIAPSEAYRRLIAAEDDQGRALVLIAEARDRSEAAGESTAPWDLAELELHIDSGNAQEAQTVLARIERQHLDDPQVAAAVYRLLYETGVISPEEMAGAATAEPAPVMAGAAESDESRGRIWTPDSDRPTGGGGKSTFWTPS
jgi:hypothetical protein